MNHPCLEPPLDLVPPEAEIVLRVIPLPADTFMGDRISSGWLLSRLVTAGSVLPGRKAGRHMNLVRLSQVRIQSDLRLRHIVQFEGAMVAAADNFIVDVWAFAEANNRSRELVLRARLEYSPIAEEAPFFDFSR